MKKTGKALSLVLSLALVVSSLTATFASAAADSPTAGGSVALTGKTAFALIKGSTQTEVALPTAAISYTTASGKVYDQVVNPGTQGWSSSNTGVASIDGVNIKAGSTKGSATLTFSYSGVKLGHNSVAGDTVTVSGSKTITAQTYDVNDEFISDAATTGIIPTPTTNLSVNDAPTYHIYKVSANGTTDELAKFDAVASNSCEFTSTAPTVVNITKATGVVVAQPTDAVKITSAQITGVDKTVPATPVTSTLVLHVLKQYTTSSSHNTITAASTYGSGSKTTTDDNYDVTGYDIVGTQATMNSGSVNSIDVTGAVSIAKGTVANAVQSGSTVTLTGGTVGAINAVSNVSVTGATVSGNVASDGTVTVGDKGVTGAIRAKGNVTLNQGATAGSITGVPTPTAANAADTVAYPTATVTSARVNGSIAANAVTIDGTGRDINNKVVPAVVTGNVVVYNNTTPTAAAGSATIGTTTTGTVSVGGSVLDNDGGATITLNQATDGTTTVGNVVGRKPASSNEALSTILNLNGVTSTFASLPNFATINVDAASDVTVNSALTTNTLNVLGKATLSSATVGTIVEGTGTITIPSGSLVAKGGFSGSLTLVPTNTVAVGTLVFKSISNQAANVTIPGVTLEEKDNGDQTYNYVAKTVAFAGIRLDKATDKVAKGYSDTITAYAIPDGQKLPAGDSIKWVVADGSYVTLTPSADTMSATVKATDWSDVNLGGANDVVVTAYVVDKNGNEVYDYAEKTCTVTTIEKPEVVPAKYTSDTTTALSLKAGQQYCYKITSADGSDPTMVFGTSGVAKIVKTTVSGNAYFISVEGVKDGATGVYIGGSKTPTNVITVAGTAFQYKSDTTVVTVKTGKAYTFKITADKGASAPVFQVCTFNSSKNSKETVLVNTVKNANGTTDYFYKIVATNSPKGAHGAYVNGVKVATVTVA